MNFQLFSYKELKKLIRVTDAIIYQKRLKIYLQRLEEILAKPEDYVFQSLRLVKRQNKNMYLITDNENRLYDEFTLRKINHNLKRIYKLKQSDRTSIIKQIQNLLNEKTNCYVYRLDIKNFYESIDKELIYSIIDSSYVVTRDTKILLQKFLFETFLEKGLPRGINLSATLSELYMKNFDRYVKNIEGVYYYARFVDDIIVFSTNPISIGIFNDYLKSNLGLDLNLDKTREYKLDFKSKQNAKLSIDYLGYNFKVDISLRNKNPIIKIVTEISERKINKIKSRIIYSLIDYNRSLDYSLLKKRLLFLTCTYTISSLQGKISKYKNDTKLHSGLFYSYSCIDSNGESLKLLDKFFRNILFSKNKFSKNLSLEQKKELAKISFYIAYHRKFYRNFHKDIKEIKNITRCWSYV